MTTCILYENPSSTITIIDIPRSIEVAQGATKDHKRLLSTEPLQHPFPSLEPKSEKARANLGDHTLDDLLLQKRLELALVELAEQYNGAWCLPRITENESSRTQKPGPEQKRKRRSDEETLQKLKADEELKEDSEANAEGEDGEANAKEEIVVEGDSFFHNPNQQRISIQYGPGLAKAFLPPKSTALHGDLATTRDVFTQRAPKFNIVILDPPWPNRSARRKKGYDISHNHSDIRTLLSLLPVAEHLAQDALVGVWITNKPGFRDLALEMFEEWGVRLVEELVWLKVTAAGEPICALDGRWRKPYEVLLIGRKGAADERGGEVNRRVLVAVPDVHSRKPNMKEVFQRIMGRRREEGEEEEEEEYEALEVFARSLTAGWWGWGNEVLKFQEQDCWVESGT